MKAMPLLTLILLAGCAAPISNSCAWLKPIQPDPGFQKRWTRSEKNQIDAFDKAVDANCGKSL